MKGPLDPPQRSEVPQRPGMAGPIIRGGAWALAGKAVGMAVGLVRYGILSRLLSPGELGAYFMIGTVVVFASTVGRLGLTNAVVRLLPDALARNERALGRAVVRRTNELGTAGAVAISVALAFVGDWIASTWFESSALQDTIYLAPAWVLANTLATLFAESLRGFKDIRGATILSQTFFAVAHCVLIIAWYLGVEKFTLSDAVWSSVVAAVLNAAAGAIMVGLKTAPLPRGGKISTREVVALAAPLWVTNLSLFALVQADIWILGAFRPDEEVALYGAAARLVMLVLLPLNIINLVLPPFITELHALGDKQRLQRILRAAATASGLPTVLVFVAMTFAGGLILRLTYGEYYERGAPILVVLALGQLGNVLAGSCGTVLMMTGHQHAMMRITVVVGAITVLGQVAAVTRFGAIGVAGVAAASLIAQNIVMLAVVRRRSGVWTHMTFEREAVREISRQLGRTLIARSRGAPPPPRTEQEPLERRSKPPL